MDQEQPLEEPELCDAVVGGEDGLHPLLPADPHPDVRGLDHGHVVGPVPDGEGHGLLVLLDQLHHQGLLQGRHPAADDGRTVLCHAQKCKFHIRS